MHENDVPLAHKPLLYTRLRSPLRYFASKPPAATGARNVLCGHGEPWHDGAEAAAGRAGSGHRLTAGI